MRVYFNRRGFGWAGAGVALVFLALLLVYGKTLFTEGQPPPEAAAITMASPSDVTPQASAVPSVVPTVDIVAMQATLVAVVDSMPTYTPYPHAPGITEKVEGEQRTELIQVARKTVTAMMHITPAPEPPSTPEPPLTPYPGPRTETAGAGAIVYNNFCGTDKLISARNKWREYIGTRILTVCAGRTYLNPQAGPQQGALLIEDYDKQTNTILTGPDLYTVPIEVAWVEVVDAVGERLTLEADTGALFYFDVPTRQWVNP
jgi:hypothetical protein